MKAIVLAAGHERNSWRQKADNKSSPMPNPLLCVQGKPIIQHVVEGLLKIQEITGIIIVTNAEYYKMFQDWRRSFESGVPIKLINDGTTSDQTRLGAVKDLDLAIVMEDLNDDTIVVAGDDLPRFGLKEFITFFRQKGSTAIAATDVKDKKLLARRYGAVEVGSDGRIVGFEEKPVTPKTSLASTCFYLLRRDHLKLVLAYNEEHPERDAPGYFLQWLYKRVPVYAWSFPLAQYRDIEKLKLCKEVV